ncbi:SE1832 family protein [Rossellomorea vietnamensis]|uniref:SE1832 family protein n=1 Tax=Rossellomorea TaxID=2837508 RepID=UPI00165375D6|nr:MULTISPECIES: SE1832 family protein [Rossellomorea]
MTKRELEYKITEVKADYVRIQADMEKVDSVGGNTKKSEERLEQLENELAELNKQLSEL